MFPTGWSSISRMTMEVGTGHTTLRRLTPKRLDRSTSRANDRWVRVDFVAREDGGREVPALNSYRPLYRILPDYLTSTMHFFLDTTEVAPGATAEALVKFLAPDEYPASLSVGQVVEVCEGARRVVGHATILQVLNPILECDKPLQSTTDSRG